MHIDRFGNLITNIDEGLLKKIFKNKSFEIRVGSCIIKKLVPSYVYAKQGEPVGLIGSSNLLEIASHIWLGRQFTEFCVLKTVDETQRNVG